MVVHAGRSPVSGPARVRTAPRRRFHHCVPAYWLSYCSKAFQLSCFSMALVFGVYFLGFLRLLPSVRRVPPRAPGRVSGSACPAARSTIARRDCVSLRVRGGPARSGCPRPRHWGSPVRRFRAVYTLPPLLQNIFTVYTQATLAARDATHTKHKTGNCRKRADKVPMWQHGMPCRAVRHTAELSPPRPA